MIPLLIDSYLPIYKMFSMCFYLKVSCSQGTIASIFKEDSTLGLKYVFDIQRTCREVYDNARRALYQSESQEISTSLHTTSVSSKPEEHISLQLDSMDIKNIASLLEGGCKVFTLHDLGCKVLEDM